MEKLQINSVSTIRPLRQCILFTHCEVNLLFGDGREWSYTRPGRTFRLSSKSLRLVSYFVSQTFLRTWRSTECNAHHGHAEYARFVQANSCMQEWMTQKSRMARESGRHSDKVRASTRHAGAAKTTRGIDGIDGIERA